MPRPGIGTADPEHRLHVAPPLNLSDADAASGLAILDEALDEVDTFLA